MHLQKYHYAGILGAVIAGILIVLFQFNLLSGGNQSHQESNQVAYLDFSYEEANSGLKSALGSQRINMSNPLKFNTPTTINQYCNFLTDSKKQSLVTYCTSAELKDTRGFLGDIDMVGSADAPGLVIVAIQSNPMLTNYDAVKVVFGTVINDTICQCWEKEKPKNYPTLSSMMDAFRDFHLNGKKPDSRTTSIPLGNKHFEIELTTNGNGYLWKLLVGK
jgi:hypothetical protein